MCINMYSMFFYSLPYLVLLNLKILFHPTFFFFSEKGYGKHQHSIGIGDEIWEVCAWLETNAEDSASRKS